MWNIVEKYTAGARSLNSFQFSEMNEALKEPATK